jgi:uncharacterized metal-binding protein
MSSGCVHGAISVGAGIAVGSAIYYATGDAACAAAVGAGSLAGGISSPDLDEGSPTSSHNHVQRGLGIFVAALWWLLWQPYVLLMTRHRSVMSHFPVVSTIGRVGYLGAILIPIMWGLEYLGKLPSIKQAIDTIVWSGNVLAPLSDRLQVLIPSTFEIPGMAIWIGFLIAAAVIAGMAFFLRIDFPQRTQKVIFWVMIGAFVLIGGICRMINPAAGTDFVTMLPIGVWAFAGLCLSDTLHFLLDVYAPIFI